MQQTLKKLGKDTTMLFWMLLSAGLFFPTLHLLLWTKDRSLGNVAFIFLRYLLPITTGLGGLVAFLGHTLRADEIARSIGWQPGSPFQFEVAVANLAFGILGLLCIRFQGGFWGATIIGYGVFLEGAAYGHIREILVAGNWAENNAGVVLFADLFFPVFQLLLLAIASHRKDSGVDRQGESG